MAEKMLVMYASDDLPRRTKKAIGKLMRHEHLNDREHARAVRVFSQPGGWFRCVAWKAAK